MITLGIGDFNTVTETIFGIPVGSTDWIIYCHSKQTATRNQSNQTPNLWLNPYQTSGLVI